MFRNLRCYQIANPWPETEEALSEALAEKPFRPCGPYTEKTGGWEAPADHEGAALCRRLDGADLLQLRTQSRVLPVAAIREELEARVATYRQRTGDEPNRGQLSKLKQETRDELLPKSLLKSERTRAFVIPSESLLVIDAASAGKAEWFIDQLRPCFARLNCVPLAFNSHPESLLKKMFLGDVPRPFSLGNECRLQDPSDRLSIGAFRNINLDDKAVRQHVLDGMRLTHLGLGFDEYASFVLSDDAVISKLKFLQGEDIDTIDDEDPIAKMDADFVLLSGTFKRIIKELKTLMGGFVPVDTSTL